MKDCSTYTSQVVYTFLWVSIIWQKCQIFTLKNKILSLHKWSKGVMNNEYTASPGFSYDT